MDSKEKFFDRELSALEFNARVLAEGMDPTNPLLERLKFLGIVSSNLDEFFMVRVASLKESGRTLPVVRQKAFELDGCNQSLFPRDDDPRAGRRRAHPCPAGSLQRRPARLPTHLL